MIYFYLKIICEYVYPGWVYDCEIRYFQNNQIPWIPPGARVAGMHEFPKVGVQK